MAINKVIFYADNTPVFTRTSAPFDADYTFTGLADGAHELKCEIYNNDVLADTKTVNITVSTTALWYTLVIADYVARVEADYGVVENETALTTSLSSSTEQEYLDAFVIYNSNGGHRPGKIYDVRDYGTVKSFIFTNILDFPNKNGTVTPGFLDYQGRSIANKLEYSSNSNLNVSTSITSESGNTFLTLSIEVKKGNLRYVRFGMAFFTGSTDGGPYYFDLDTGNYISAYTGLTSEDLGNGWYRLTRIVDASSSDNTGQYYMGFSSTSSGVAATTGEFGYMGKVQAIENNGYLLAENNPTTDLTVIGGGGTRFLPDGTLEKVEYYNTVRNSNDVTQWGLNFGMTTIQNYNISVITEDTSLGKHHVGIENTGNDSTVGFLRTIEFKKVDARYVTFGTRYGSGYATECGIIDLDTATLAKGSTSGTFTITSLADGWVKVELFEQVVSSNNNRYIVGISNGTTEASMEYTGTGRSVQFRKPQQVLGNTEKPYQININSAAFPKIDYTTGQASFLIEPTRTNIEPYSYDLITSGLWTQQRSLVATLNQVGITGKANTALLLEDNTTGDYSEFTRNIATFGGVQARASCWIKKDNDETRFPEIYVSFRRASDSSTLEGCLIQINTKTGASGFRINSSPYNDLPYQVIDRGDWWEVSIKTLSDTDRLAAFWIRPAFTNTLGGGLNNATTGSIILGHVEVCESSVLVETPIITNGASVTRTKNTYTNTNFNLMEGSVYLHVDKNRYSEDTSYCSMLELENGDDNIGFRWKPSGDLDLVVVPTNNNFTITTNAVSNTSELKALITFDPSGYKVYLNGTKEFEASDTLNPLTDLNMNFTFGASGRSGNYRVLDMKILPVLTDVEATNLTTL